MSLYSGAHVLITGGLGFIGSNLGIRLLDFLQDHLLKVFIHFPGSALIRDNTVKVLVAHGNGTVHQVAQGVGQIGIGTLCYQFPGQITVIFKRHLMQYIVTYCIYAEIIYQIIRIQHVSFGLAHLSVALEEPRMAEYLLGKGQIQGH